MTKRIRKRSVWAVVLVMSLASILAWGYWPETPRQKVHRLLRGFDRQPKGKFDLSLYSLFVSYNRLKAEWERLGPEAVPALIEALNSDRYPMRYLAARRLSEIGVPAAVPGLIQALEDDCFVVRMWSAHALGDMRDSRAVEPLIHRLQDLESCVRSEAASALGRCRDQRAVALSSACCTMTSGGFVWMR